MPAYPGNEDPYVNGQRDMVATIGNKMRELGAEKDDLARRRFPHWWQWRLRREWADGFRFHSALAQNKVWHSMP